MEDMNEQKQEDNIITNPKPVELSLVELKAIWYDLLVQKQQIEMQMNQINEQIAQKINKG